MKIVVTGGGGFIGRAVKEQAEARGWEVSLFDRTVGLDVTKDELPPADAVVHLAGILGTSELFDHPEIAVEINVGGTLNVLKACAKHKMAFVGIAMPDVWQNVYQATKYCAARLASAWRREYGIKVSHVRAFNAFGEHQAFGPGHPQKIIPTFAVKAWRREPIPIWGDGQQWVDLIDVRDVAHMLVDAVEVGGEDEMFDAGTGLPMTVNEVANLVAIAAGSRVRHQYLPMRRGEIPGTKCVAQGLGWPKLNWRPIANQDRIEEVVLWYKAVANQQELPIATHTTITGAGVAANAAM